MDSVANEVEVESALVCEQPAAMDSVMIVIPSAQAEPFLTVIADDNMHHIVAMRDLPPPDRQALE